MHIAPGQFWAITPPGLTDEYTSHVIRVDDGKVTFDTEDGTRHCWSLKEFAAKHHRQFVGEEHEQRVEAYDETPTRWREHPKWHELHEVLGELVDNAEVAEAIVASHVIDAERMKRLCAALHLMPKLIAKALLDASELPGYAPPEKPTRPSGALDVAERLSIPTDGTPTCVGENSAGEPVRVTYAPETDACCYGMLIAGNQHSEDCTPEDRAAFEQRERERAAREMARAEHGDPE